MPRGKNAITLFVLLTALTLWLKFLASDQPPMLFSWPVVIKLMTVSVALGLAYAAWNVGILHGNVSLLAAASYFTPVLSSALAAILLSATLSWSFWQGPGWYVSAPALLVRHPPLAEIASGYRQHHASDIAGLIAGEKQDRIRLFRQRAVPVQHDCSPPSDRRPADTTPFPARSAALRYAASGAAAPRSRPGHGVNPDTAAAVLRMAIEAGQRVNAAFRRRVRHPIHSRRRHRRNVDDAAFAPASASMAAPRGSPQRGEQRAADLFLNLIRLVFGKGARPDGCPPTLLITTSIRPK